MAKGIIRSDEVEHSGGPYSQAVQAGGFVFLSGQTGVDRDGRLKEGIEAQTRQALQNAQAILQAAGAKLDDVVQVRAYIADLVQYSRVRERGAPRRRSDRVRRDGLRWGIVGLRSSIIDTDRSR